MRIVVINHLTLDGVMQGPGRPDEDTRDGFARGGWAAARSDHAILAAVGQHMGRPGRSLLFGRRTYEEVLTSWNRQGGPFRDSLNEAPKYVASSDPATTLAWPNSTLLHGDVPAAVAGLRGQDGGPLVIMGSGVLIRSLLPLGLIDELLLLVHPVVLGDGRRLFEPDGNVVPLRLLGVSTSPSGVVIASYGGGAAEVV